MPCSSKSGKRERKSDKTSQYASVPGIVPKNKVAVANFEDGKALMVTEVRTPKVEPPPYKTVSMPYLFIFLEGGKTYTSHCPKEVGVLAFIDSKNFSFWSY